MIIKYKYKDVIHNSFDEIKMLFSNVSFPETITQEVLAPFNITILEEEDYVYTPTQEQVLATLVNAVQEYLDSVAQQRGYEGIISLCSYKGSTDATFNKEGTAGVVWRDLVWRTCYTIRDEVLAGTRAVPTAEEFISELPVFTWGD